MNEPSIWLVEHLISERDDPSAFVTHVNLPGKEIECADCKTWSPASKWTVSDDDCPTCGGHEFIKCPSCPQRFDPYHSEQNELNVRDIEP